MNGATISADIISYTSLAEKDKREIETRINHLFHAFIVFIFSYILSFDFNFWFAAILLAIFHLLADILKSFHRSTKYTLSVILTIGIRYRYKQKT
jgi:hypothetical protein